MSQIHMCIPPLFFLSPLSYSRLAISQYSLILKQVGWVHCLKIFMYTAGIERLIYSTNNQVQLHLTTMENQLDAIQKKLESNL